MSKQTWKIAGINFDHFHMGDLLRMAHEHPNAEIVGISDEQPERMNEAQKNFGITSENVFTDHRECLEKTKPDIVILCPAAARHGEWTENVAPAGVHILMEKPFAATVEEADRMVAAMSPGKQLAINWPLRWYRSHITAHRLIQEGTIGDVTEVHFYDGNRGPLYHGADKLEKEPTAEEKDASWFYKADQGGGSMLDYLGYGTTLGTWFHGNKKPIEVTCMMDEPEGLEVDEHSITIARYECGLSKFETRWGTFTDPWTHQPQPKCGFVIKGTDGTISNFDYDSFVRVQTRDDVVGSEVEADELKAPFENPVQYLIDCVENDRQIEGPLSPAVSRIGQQVVDTAFASAKEKRTLPLRP
ncbi:MAG: glucose-fructose oxidoreductase [Verrucomicrobiales bacterium]|nr:glucose-fructose oxidoreductase [Verrucomicrobiales bacterium]|tara:strand:- start:2951 stop:4024 length:1074 start_codon:yes stop_codon:yes gene_type:complete